MTLAELFQNIDPLDKQGHGEDVYRQLRLFFDESINRNYVDANAKDMQIILVRMLAYRSLNGEHKKALLDLLCEKGFLIHCFGVRQIVFMLQKSPDYFEYCLKKLADKKQEIIDVLNQDALFQVLLSMSMRPSEFFRRLIILGLFPEKVIAFIKDAESRLSSDNLSDLLFLSFLAPASEDSQAYRDFYNSDFVQNKLSGMRLMKFSKTISNLDEEGKADKVFEAFKIFIEQINPHHFNDNLKDRPFLLRRILSYGSLSGEGRKELLDSLVRKAPCIRFLNAEQIVDIILINPDGFCYFFRKSSDAQRVEIARALNNGNFNEVLSSSKVLSPIFVSNNQIFRILINCGLDPKKIIDFLKKSDIKKYLVRASIFSGFFPIPTVEDSGAYRDFYNSDFVQIILLELRYRIRLSLLLTTGESKTSFEGFLFDRGGGIFTEDFSSVKNSYLGLIQKELKYFAGKTLESFPEEKKDAIFKVVSDLMESSSEEENHIVLLSIDRGGPHAEGFLRFEDFLLKVNRGGGSSSKLQKPGITIFRENPLTKKEERDYISEVERSSLSGSKTKGNVLDEKIDSMNLEFLYSIEMKPQSYANCTLATSKAFVLASYYVAIRKILSEQEPHLTDKDLHKQAEALARKIYKEFTRLYRLEEAKSYLAWHEKIQAEFRTQPEFKYIDEKILAKIIGIFGEESSIKSIIEENNLLDRLSSGALALAIKSSMSKGNISLMKELMIRFQSSNPEQYETLNAALNFLEGIKKEVFYREELFTKFSRLISTLDNSLMEILRQKFNDVLPFSESTQPTTTHPQFDSFTRQNGHPKPPEPDTENTTSSSPREPGL